MPYKLDEISSDIPLTVTGLLQSFGTQLVEELRKSLQEKVTGFTSKKLEQSIDFQIDETDTSVRFRLYMEEYGDYVDQGVQGVGGTRKSTTIYGRKGDAYINVAPNSVYTYKTKKPPVEELEIWSSVHGLNPYALSQSIYRKGIKPNYFYSDVVDRTLVDQLINQLEEIGARKIEVSLIDYFNGNIG